MTFTFPPCALPPGSLVWAYLRDSGGESQDLASQRAYMLAYCQHYELHLDRFFEDAAVSGSSTLGRERFDAMIDLARRSDLPATDAILYWDIKRFARNFDDSQYYKADLRRRGYLLIPLADDIPDGKIGRMWETFLEIKAEEDLEQISRDSKRGLAFIVGMKDSEGRYVGLFPGRPPTFFRGEPYDTGLTRNDGRPRVVQRLAADPATWELGRRAWAMRAEGASYKAIERELRLFSHTANPLSTYVGIFRNEIYLGRLNYGGRVYEEFVPALATIEQWEAAQRLRAAHPRSPKWTPDKVHPRARAEGKYLLSGLCVCAVCTGRMHGGTNTRPDRDRFWSFYRCTRQQARPDDCDNKQVSARRLEVAVVETVQKRILTPAYIRELADQVNQLLADDDGIERRLEQERRTLASLDRKISNLLDQLEETPSASLRARLEAREAERRGTERAIERLMGQLGQAKALITPEMVERLIVSSNTLDKGDFEIKQAFLRQVLDKIEVGPEVAAIHYKHNRIFGEVLRMPPTGPLFDFSNFLLLDLDFDRVVTVTF